MELEDLERHVRDLWTAQTRSTVQIAALKTMLRVCFALLKDDPRFAPALSRVTSEYAGKALHAPIQNESAVQAFLEELKDLTPAEYRDLLSSE